MPSKKCNSLFHFFLFMMVLIKFFIAIKAQYMVEILERTALGGHRAVVRCDATGANFGEDVLTFTFGINNIGCALPAEPTMACSDVLKPELNSTTQCLVDFAVVPRGNCSFSEKAYYVQTAKPAGYTALIVYNLKGQSPIPMSGSKYAELVQIPVVMVKYECMQSMLGHYTAERGYLITIKSSPGYYDLIKYLFPFVIIVGICFVVLFISLMIRLCRERRRLARKRLPRSQLKKIPTKKYRKGDPEETCAICLEDFQESEKLRILACRHAYHCKCIDPWLTKSRKVCPVCKRRVGPRNESSSDSDETDNERATSNESIASGIAESTSTMLAMSNRDNDPLLQNAQPIATSSHDLPYPQNTISSIQQPSTSTPNGFLRATRNLLNFSNFTQSSRCELFHNHVNTALGNNNTSTRETTTSVEPRQTNPIHSSPEIEDLSNTVQQQIQQQQPNANSRQYGRFSLVNIGSRLAGLVRQGASSASLSNGANPPHILLENEEDASTTVTREDLDTLSRNICESTDETASNSGDGHSMTTQHSNHHLVSVTVETPPPSLQPTIATLAMERTDNV